MAIKVLGVDHIHVNNRDIRKARELLTRLFDSDTSPVADFEPFRAYNSTVFLRDTEGRQPYLDLFEPTTPDGPVGGVMASGGGPSVSYVSFRVENLEEAAAHAESLGLREVSRIGFGEMRQIQYDTREVLGFMVELVHYGPGFWESLEDIKQRLAAGETVLGLRYVDL